MHQGNETSHRLTIEAIQQALFMLMKEKDFSSITITDIIRKAGVSRSAFYKNFKNKEDVINEHMEQLLEAAFDAMDYSGSLKDKAIYIYNVINDNRENLKLLLDMGLERQLLDKANSLRITSDLTYNQQMYITLWNGAIYNVFTRMIRDENFGSYDDLMRFVDYISLLIRLPEEIR